MKVNRLWLSALATVLIPGPLLADAAEGLGAGNGAQSARELPPYLQCVPYARQVSGIAIYGDAHTWWDKAAGRYERGNRPQVGAVLAFRPHGSMQLGHVAAVSRVVDNRTVLLRHANWSPINGRRGQIENDVRAIDVSPGNDWSQVRVWYDPIKDLGTTAWPAHGFIYGNGKPAAPQRQIARAPARQSVPAVARTEQARRTDAQPARRESSAAFRNAFADIGLAPAPAARQMPVARQAAPVRQTAAPRPTTQPAQRGNASPRPAPAKDPFAAVIARYEN